MNLQHNIVCDLNKAIRSIAHYCGINGTEEDAIDEDGLEYTFSELYGSGSNGVPVRDIDVEEL